MESVYGRIFIEYEWNKEGDNDRESTKNIRTGGEICDERNMGWWRHWNQRSVRDVEL